MHMLITVLIVLVLVGAALYIINVVPLDNAIKAIIRVVVIVAAVVYVIAAFSPMVHAQPVPGGGPVIMRGDHDRGRDWDRGDRDHRGGWGGGGWRGRPSVVIPFPFPVFRDDYRRYGRDWDYSYSDLDNFLDMVRRETHRGNLGCRVNRDFYGDYIRLSLDCQGYYR